MYKVVMYLKVRQCCLLDNKSQRQVSKEFGLNRRTVSKMLKISTPPGYRRKSCSTQPKLDPHKDFINHIIESDKKIPRKQKHTAKRIYDRLKAECDYTGSYIIVRKYVAQCRLQGKEMFIPLSHAPGKAQVDFSESLAIIGGVKQTIHVFNMDIPQSDACFIKAYPRENTEAFCDGHVSAFSFFEGVCTDILYDNTKIAVAKILGNGDRQKTKSFTELQSHYLFKDHFARVAKGNDKGKVENLVGYARRNFMVPLPNFESFEALNVYLLKRCKERQNDVLRGHKISIKDRLVLDKASFPDLPECPYEACSVSPARVSSQSLVRYKDTDYSVPVRYGYQNIFVKAYVDKIFIVKGADVIATHKRSYEHGDICYNFLHYLPLLERKANALDQAAPLKDLVLPPVFKRFKNSLVSRDKTDGQRTYIKCLRLLETYGVHDVEKGLYMALDLGIFSLDGVKHLILSHIDKRPINLKLLDFPNIPMVCVHKTSATSYMSLLGDAS